MPQVPGIRPFDECDLADQFRFDPVAFFHLFRCQRLAPPRCPFLRQVFKRARAALSFLRAGKISFRIRGTKPSFTFATNMSSLSS